MFWRIVSNQEGYQMKKFLFLANECKKPSLKMLFEKVTKIKFTSFIYFAYLKQILLYEAFSNIFPSDGTMALSKTILGTYWKNGFWSLYTPPPPKKKMKEGQKITILVDTF